MLVPKPLVAAAVQPCPMIGSATSTPVHRSGPPQNVSDFLWNIHTLLASSTGSLKLVSLRQAYLKQFSHKCHFERFLVVRDGDLEATLKRIPHIVSLSHDNGITYVTSTMASCTSK